jgi:CubicO group peptidase (beta-lactamase class C family)
MKARILTPLGMTATRTSLREAWNDPRTARGYWWDEAGRRIRPVTLETLGINIDGTGLAIYEVERVEVGIALAPDTFTLQSSTASRQIK